jgi:hypothetical protein
VAGLWTMLAIECLEAEGILAPLEVVVEAFVTPLATYDLQEMVHLVISQRSLDVLFEVGNMEGVPALYRNNISPLSM